MSPAHDGRSPSTARVMGRYMLFSILLIACVNQVRAQDAATQDDLLSGRSWMAAQTSWPCRYKGRFEQTRTLAGSDLAVNSRGRFWQNCTQGLVWQVDTPRRESRIYTRSQTDVLINRRGSVKALDGWVERRVGVLLRSVFDGDTKALLQDFELIESNDSEVELEPRDARVKAQINALFLGGNATEAHVRLETQSENLRIQLTAFSEHDGAQAACRAWFDDQHEVCAALRSPRQLLESASGN